LVDSTALAIAALLTVPPAVPSSPCPATSRDDAGRAVTHIQPCPPPATDAAGGDPDLEPGFPVPATHTSGSYYIGPAIHTLVGQLDADPELELLVTAAANGPLYAWNHDGTAVPGWPATGVPGLGYVALGNLTNASPGMELFSAHLSSQHAVWSDSPAPLAGWPVTNGFATTPGTLADVEGDGVDEVFFGTSDYTYRAYRADGTVLPGWPRQVFLGAQDRHTPAVTDLDGNGDLEVLGVTDPGNGMVHVLGFHHDGTALAGFPVTVRGEVSTYPVVGDVDGDGALEIVIVGQEDGFPFRSVVSVLSTAGAVERTLTATNGVPYGTAPALADLDGDGRPEIIVQTEGALNVWRGDGTIPSGWPQVWSQTQWLGNSSPVVGDLTGDGRPEIAVTGQVAGSSTSGEVRVYDAAGRLHPRFPKALLIGGGAVPAIADVDRDGRNELVVSGDFWNGSNGSFDKLWVYDLGGPAHGAVPWGQLMGGPRHQGRFGYLDAAALVADFAAGPGSDGNGVLEPGETAPLAPRWRNRTGSAATFSGAGVKLTGPGAPGVVYSLPDGQASYGPVADGATGDCRPNSNCYMAGVSDPSPRPATHWDALFSEDTSRGDLETWALHVGESFVDVPRGSGFYPFIETLLHRGVTGGCGPDTYCPLSPVTREQMAVFVLSAKEGALFTPPACATPLFPDVPAASPYCRWIEELARRGVVSGCGGGNYCPAAPVTRDQMAVFVLRTLDPGLDPPACGTPMFPDVPASSPFCRWVEELARRDVVTGCGGGNYCPASPVTREQMGVFLAVSFGLTL
jgi:hypothetical protein